MSTGKANNSAVVREILDARREVMAHSDGREYSEQLRDRLAGRYTEAQIDEVVWGRGLECETALRCLKNAIPSTIAWAEREGLRAVSE